MKIDRLLGILAQLSEKKSVSAPELAERFEVSRRTIIRDIDALDRAGFPIVTKQGCGGGISLMEGFHFDKKLVKREEMLNIITGLKGLESVSRSPRIELFLKRIGMESESPISIDLASHYRDSLTQKIELLDRAVKESHNIRFNYYSKKGENRRVVEPRRIVYRWSDWYLLGRCRDNNDFRLFKLNRLWELELTDELFTPEPISQDRDDRAILFTDSESYEVLFDRSVKYRLVEDYGPDSFDIKEDGLLHFSGGYSNREFIVSWLLSFGDKAQVISPQSLVNEMREISKKMMNRYSEF